MTDYRKERDAAITAAVNAARLICYHAGNLDADDVREKGVHDLVTRIDEEAQHIIIESLDAAFPGYAVLAEEEVAARRPPSTSPRRWIIDPIDGTTNFTHGLSPYSVSIALQDGDALAVGVVLDVAGDELFSAVRSGGLYVNGRPAQVSHTSSLAQSLISTGFPYRSFGHVDAYLSAMKTLMGAASGLRRPGSAAIDLAHVAAGRFDGFFEFGLKPWDVAAGIVLVREGGGLATDFSGEVSMLGDRGIVADNGLIHTEFLEALRPLRD